MCSPGEGESHQGQVCGREYWLSKVTEITATHLQREYRNLKSTDTRSSNELKCPFCHYTRVKCKTCQTDDDVVKWKHFPCYWPFVRGIHRSPVNHYDVNVMGPTCCLHCPVCQHFGVDSELYEARVGSLVGHLDCFDSQPPGEIRRLFDTPLIDVLWPHVTWDGNCGRLVVTHYCPLPTNLSINTNR